MVAWGAGNDLFLDAGAAYVNAFNFFIHKQDFISDVKEKSSERQYTPENFEWANPREEKWPNAFHL